jgi:hypothetical protein
LDQAIVSVAMLDERAAVMTEYGPNAAITSLIQSLPQLPKVLIIEFWTENFGKFRVFPCGT